MRYIAIAAFVLFLSGCVDEFNMVSTSSGGDSTPPEVVTVKPEVVIVAEN